MTLSQSYLENQAKIITRRNNSLVPHVEEFSFDHAIIWSYPKDQRDDVIKRRGEVVTSITTEIGYFIIIPQPFGIHLVVSAFDGENQYSLIGTGGHFGHIVFIDHQVDCPIEIHDSDYKADEETRQKIQEQWLSSMPDGLQTAVRVILQTM